MKIGWLTSQFLRIFSANPEECSSFFLLLKTQLDWKSFINIFSALLEEKLELNPLDFNVQNYELHFGMVFAGRCYLFYHGKSIKYSVSDQPVNKLEFFLDLLIILPSEILHRSKYFSDYLQVLAMLVRSRNWIEFA